MTDAYLAPIQLRSTTLTLIYSTISLPSWSAGSHQVSCSIGATLGNGGWSTLLNSAKGPLMINGQPPIPPPDIPEERLNLPPIPMPIEPPNAVVVVLVVVSRPDRQTRPTTSQTDPAHAGAAGDGHDRQTAAPTPRAAAPGNTFLNGPPPPPGRRRMAPPPPDRCRRRAPPARRLPGPPPAAARLRRAAAAARRRPSRAAAAAATAGAVAAWPCG